MALNDRPPDYPKPDAAARSKLGHLQYENPFGSSMKRPSRRPRTEGYVKACSISAALALVALPTFAGPRRSGPFELWPCFTFLALAPASVICISVLIGGLARWGRGDRLLPLDVTALILNTLLNLLAWTLFLMKMASIPPHRPAPGGF